MGGTEALREGRGPVGAGGAGRSEGGGVSSHCVAETGAVRCLLCKRPCRKQHGSSRSYSGMAKPEVVLNCFLFFVFFKSNYLC